MSLFGSAFSKMVKDTKKKLALLKEKRLSNYMMQFHGKVSIELMLPSSFQKWDLCVSFICACARSKYRHHHAQGTSERAPGSWRPPSLSAVSAGTSHTY